MGWYAAGGVMVILILVLAGPVLRGDRPPPAPGVQAGVAPPAGAGSSTVDLASMTPRQAADRLFNRVMTAVSAGDSAEVQGFLPMAVAAYERARPLDNDGAYHLALLQLTSLDFASALASAEAALAEYPDHLLLLSAAAEAAKRMGDAEAASAYYRRLLDAWDAQTALGLAEYQIHATMLPEIEAAARSFLEGG
jgi:tetratricopeptide (TPR) repeat protein